MKKITVLVFYFVLAFSLNTFSQIKNIIATSDSSIVVNNVYAGLLNSTSFNSDLDVEHAHNLRIGANATWQLVPWLKVKTLVAYGRVNDKDMNINFFSLKLHSKGERLGLEIGRMPTLSTELIPMPLSATGHFSTWAESRATGPAIGAKSIIRFNEKNTLGAGISLRNDEPEYHLKLESGIFKAASSYATANEKFQVLASAKMGEVYSIVIFDKLADSRMLANFTSVSIGNEIELCLDAGYEFNSKKFEKLEFGILKNFDSHFLKGLFYLCYKQEAKVIETTFLLHI
jgi:hypothetical protein